MATYVALSRPPSLAQLISVGLPDELRTIIEGGPPQRYFSKIPRHVQGEGRGYSY